MGSGMDPVNESGMSLSVHTYYVLNQSVAWMFLAEAATATADKRAVPKRERTLVVCGLATPNVVENLILSLACWLTGGGFSEAN